ncbi:MAG: hypothetical protein JXA66_08780 [Oligoflexia bacterium]|nr:hypothetical protein [Oligoflexia bacterium]
MNRVTETNYNDNSTYTEQDVCPKNETYTSVDTTYTIEDFLRKSSIVESFDE